MKKSIIESRDEKPTPGWKKILAPTHYSERTQEAVRTATNLAEQCGGKITLLHVVQFPALSCSRYGVLWPYALPPSSSPVTSSGPKATANHPSEVSATMKSSTTTIAPKPDFLSETALALALRRRVPSIKHRRMPAPRAAHLPW
ncbi:MAG: universal stress protein [Limisphaerales bacterium]